MLDNGFSVEISWTKIVTAVFTGLVALCVWLLRKLGDRHITTLNEVVKELSNVKERLAAIEGRLDERDHLHNIQK